MTPSVLFVSKAIVPPYRDGSSCLVRHLAPALTQVRPTVLTTQQAPPLPVESKRIYKKPSKYSPPILDNARVLAHLLTNSQHDIWHFVFAPNPLSSHAGNLLRRVKHTKVVQTIASQPRSFQGVEKLLFGDHIIALSHHTARHLHKQGIPNRHITVISPPISDLSRTEDQARTARIDLGIPEDVPLILYAGDLEFSRGSTWMADAIPLILDMVPDAIIAFACRTKTKQAVIRRRILSKRLERYGRRVLFLDEVPDLPSLMASACAMPFVVDDLYGKVDIPYVVLEAALLQVPVLAAKHGPIEEVEGITSVDGDDAQALAGWCVDMVHDSQARRQQGSILRQSVLERHAPELIAQQVESIYLRLLG